MRYKNILSFWRKAILALSFVAGGSPLLSLAAPPPVREIVAVAPVWEWTESAPAAQGMDADMLSKLRSRLEGEMPLVRSVLIARRDQVVFEYYRQGITSESLHYIASATKSFISALAGIALEKGCLPSIDEKIVRLLPARVLEGIDPKASDITVRHLLTMTSGFAWDEKSFTPAMWKEMADFVQSAAQRRVAGTPGGDFNYDSLSVHLLSAILTEACGMSTANFAEENLFKPIGISDYRWSTDPQGYYTGPYGIRMRTRDLARFGRLFLHKGNWQGRQVIPAGFFEESTSRQNAGGWPGRTDYGYLWWVTGGAGNRRSYFANGQGGQFIYVVPEAELVFVITAQVEAKYDMRALINDFIFPAVLKDK